MKLNVRRFEYGTAFTVSRLYVNGIYQCYILEDVVRAPGVKVAGATAIPAGVYKVIVDYSNHFGKELPHVLDVPMFEGIRIHSGNTDLATEGCLLTGTSWVGTDFVGNSRAAFDALFNLIRGAISKEDEITLEVVDTR